MRRGEDGAEIPTKIADLYPGTIGEHGAILPRMANENIGILGYVQRPRSACGRSPGESAQE